MNNSKKSNYLILIDRSAPFPAFFYGDVSDSIILPNEIV